MAEARKFSVSPNIIYSLIKAQAGTLGKAVLECIMNSVDAGATQIDIKVTASELCVIDDGKGFQTRAEIEECFEVFGFEHEEGSRVYGQFGIGRAQLWNFCSTVWRTNGFLMDVDIKNKGLDYTLKENLDQQDGLVITGKFYTKLKTSEILAFENEIAELAAYAQVPVTVNGKLISKDPTKEKWTHETDDAWIRLRESGDLTVYNLGVLVRNYPAYMVGSGGLIVTKPGVRLALNMARNDILVTECKVWKRIKPYLQKQSDERVKTKRSRLTEEELSNMARRFLSGELTYDEVRKVKLITDIQGKHHTLDEFSTRIHKGTRERPVTFAAKGTPVAERAHMTGLAFVLLPSTFSRFGIWGSENQLATFETKLKTALKRSRDSQYLLSDHVKFIDDYRKAAPSLAEGYEVLSRTEWTPEEVCLLKALDAASYCIRRTFAAAEYRSTRAWAMPRERALEVGISAVAHAWTDGQTRIVFNREILKTAKEGLAGMQTLVCILLHEYLHEGPDTGTHEHDIEFYERYHHMLAQPEGQGLGDALLTAFRAYLKELKAKNLKLPSKLIQNMDVLDEAFAGEDEGETTLMVANG